MGYDKFRDPIHGFIEVSDLEREIINSAPFQRLKSIKQLAMTYYIYHGAEHTRFGHSLGVMHLATKAFRSAVEGNEDKFSNAKLKWYEQILRLIALVHDIGHAPFSHASESVFPSGIEHEDFTEKIVCETEIADIIERIGQQFVEEFGSEYAITPRLICDIYMGRDPGPNSEYTFLKSFMDGELDCDKMDYLLRDSYYCGVKYGMYDVDRLIESLTILYHNDNIPKLAVKSGGVQALEEFVLARYFMFIQVYFHRTRRYFDIMLQRALELVLPDGKYPENVDEYLKWDDCRVIQLLKEHENEFEPCRNIVRRVVYPRVYKSKTHPSPADIREFKRNCIELKKIVGEENLIIDTNADKMPHRIPINAAIGDEKSIPIFDSTQNQVTTIAEESEIIVSLSKKINIQRVYCNPICSQKAIEYIKSVNKEIDEE